MPAVTGFVCDKGVVLGDEIKGTACNIEIIFDDNDVFNLSLLTTTKTHFSGS